MIFIDTDSGAMRRRAAPWRMGSSAWRLTVGFSLFALVSLACAEPVGRVLVATGSVQAQTVAGGMRELRQDAALERGDTLITGAESNLQVRFVDGALLMVRPNSRIRLDDYRAEGNSLHSVMSLLAGGIRTLTGRIGKARRDAYLMVTPTASIGVRGTDYELRFCQGDCPAGSADGLYLGVAEGEIEARNENGVFDLKAQEYGLIRNQRAALEKLDCPPEALTGVPCASRGTIPGAEPAAGYRVGEDRERNGFSSPLLRGTNCGAPPTCTGGCPAPCP